MVDKITEQNLASFAADVVSQQLAKGQAKGYTGFENYSVANMTAQAVGKLLVGNWQSALAYMAMAVAIWWNDKNSVEDKQDEATKS